MLGSSRGVATVMADLPDEHVSFNQLEESEDCESEALCPSGCLAELGEGVRPGGAEAQRRHLRRGEALPHRAGGQLNVFTTNRFFWKTSSSTVLHQVKMMGEMGLMGIEIGKQVTLKGALPV